MSASSINCPACGAPLGAPPQGGKVTCAYCGASFEAPAAVQNAISLAYLEEKQEQLLRQRARLETETIQKRREIKDRQDFARRALPSTSSKLLIVGTIMLGVTFATWLVASGSKDLRPIVNCLWIPALVGALLMVWNFFSIRRTEQKAYKQRLVINERTKQEEQALDAQFASQWKALEDEIEALNRQIGEARRKEVKG